MVGGAAGEVLRVNWRDVTPNIAHQTAIVWPCISPAPDGGGVEWDAAGELTGVPSVHPSQGLAGLTALLPGGVHCLQAGWSGITQHMIQPHKSGDYHAHADREQVYYFTAGRGKMNIDEIVYEVKRGDAVSAALLALLLRQLHPAAAVTAVCCMSETAVW